jgi:hypothetical protein
MNKKKIIILCSGVALGVYIPGIALNYKLRKIGYETEVIVLENLIQDDIKGKINDTKKAFHVNFKLAQIGQKLARNIDPSLDQNKLNLLYCQWKMGGENHFVVISGFWLLILEQYKNFINSKTFKLDIIHMDSVPSPSWKSFRGELKGTRTFYLFDYEKRKLHYSLRVTSERHVPYKQRENRFLIHGGGWGMGTYQSKIKEFEQRGQSLDIMAYYPEDVKTENESNRYFMVDPQWSPWIKNSHNEHTFPPVAQLIQNKSHHYKNRTEYHELFYIGAHNKAIISKPGGSTLVDSFSSATPIIFLDSFGPHENYNAALWEDLGFGITYSKWENSNFSDEILLGCHNNLLKAYDKIPDFLENYA